MKNEEIERKFLVNSIPEKLKNKKEIVQHYLNEYNDIRIRKVNKKCYLTLKAGNGLKRKEYEIRIRKSQFEKASLNLEVYNEVIKTRYEIDLEDSLKAELDIYKGNLEGLVVVEVEFKSIEQAESFIIPDWFGKEVTEHRLYKNKNLAFMDEDKSKRFVKYSLEENKKNY